MHYSVPDLGIKRNHLQSAVKYYKIFIQKCLLLKIVKEKDLVELGLMSNDEAEASEAGNTTIFNHMVDHVSTGGTMKMTHDLEKKRIHKIAKYKREKEIKQKINVGLVEVVWW